VQEAAAALGMESPFTQSGDLVPELASLEEQFGAPRGSPTQWGSCLRIVSPSGGEPRTLSVLHMENNEAALCMCMVLFNNHGGGQPMLAVGTAKGLTFYPRQAEGAASGALSEPHSLTHLLIVAALRAEVSN
jgi:splicing factor 3B subunit 3